MLCLGRGGNEQKFIGDGQTFKGKLIGVLEVREARGDRMCQDALQELKMAIKASGEHKQRVNIQIAVDGLKIRDEKSGVNMLRLISGHTFTSAVCRTVCTTTPCTRSASSPRTCRTTAPSATCTAAQRTGTGSSGSRRRRPRARWWWP